MTRNARPLLAVPLALALLVAPAAAGLASAHADDFPQFTVTFTDSDAHPLPGETYTYRATVRNDGPETVRATRLQAVVPEYVRLLPRTVETDAGQVTIANVFGRTNNLISIELGALDPGERLTATWRVRLLDKPAMSFEAIATAERTADDGFPDTIAGVYALTTEPAARSTAALTGEQVRPGPGDRDGDGTASLRYVPATGRICSVTTVRQVALRSTRAVLTTTAGSAQLPAPDRTGTGRGCIAVAPQITERLFTDGGTVRVDNAAFPDGAVAGTLAAARTAASRSPEVGALP